MFMRIGEVFFEWRNKFDETVNEALLLYDSMVKFCRMAMKISFQEKHLIEMDVLSEKIIDTFVRINQEEMMKQYKFNVTYKLHKLLHYSNNVRRYGPLYLSSAMRYERCHQISKKYGNVMGCKSIIIFPLKNNDQIK